MRASIQALVLLSLSAQCFAGTALPVASVPTLSEYGLLSLGAAIAGVGIYLIRKSRK